MTRSSVSTVITVDGGDDFAATIMRVKSTFLGVEDHGIFTFVLDCESSGSGVGVGTYSLDAPEVVETENTKETVRVGSAAGMDLIIRLSKLLGGGQWENIKGKAIYVLSDDHYGAPTGVANIDTGEVLIFAEHYERWRGKD